MEKKNIWAMLGIRRLEKSPPVLDLQEKPKGERKDIVE